MFVTMLNEEQRRVLLRAAGALAERDGARPDAEEELLAALNVEAGLAEIPPMPESDEELHAEAAAAFDGDATARNVFLLELAGVAMVDGSAQSEEIALLLDLADRLDAERSAVTRALEIGELAKSLVAEGRAFIVSDAD